MSAVPASFPMRKGRLQLSHQAPGIVRLRYTPKPAFEEKPSPLRDSGFKTSGAWAGKPESRGGSLEFKTAGLQVRFDPARASFSLHTAAGILLARSAAPPAAFSKKLSEGRAAGDPTAGSTAPPQAGRRLDGVRWALRLSEGPLYYGLGEKTGPLDRSGRSWTFWNTDAYQHGPATDPLYKSIPFLMVSSPLPGNRREYWGVFFDNASRCTLDLGRLDPRRLEYTAEQGELDAYFIAGPLPADVLERYTRLTGRPYLPPLWSLGFHQSRYSYKSAAEVEALAARFQRARLPLDCIHLDIDYMRDYRVFTFDPKTFPHPEKMVKRLKQRGLHVTTIVDPGVKKDPGYKVYEQGIQQGAFCRDEKGSIFEGKVWPGTAVFPDFFDPKAAAWWGRQHADFVRNIGVEGIWNDMNEPALFEKGSMEGAVVHRTPQGPRQHARVHNLYGQAMTRATARGLAALKPGKRFYLLTRSAYAGIQALSSVWLGDNTSAWEFLGMGLAMLQGMGLSGVPFCGVDVGGFDKDAWGELLARWMQAGSLSPLFRNHSSLGTRPQEPWAFGEPVLSICRKYLDLRYRLLPYIYTLFEAARRRGEPVLRPLLYEFPQDSRCFNLGDQFMLGPWLMAAPVCKAGALNREVWLPEGIWIEYFSGRRHQGGRSILAEAPLDTMPLFVREGALLPGWLPALNTRHRDRGVLLLDLYPEPGARHELDFYEDDGESLEFQEGNFARKAFRLSYDLEARRIVLDLKPVEGRFRLPYKTFNLRFHSLAGRPLRVTVDGKAWPYSEGSGGRVVHGLMPGHVQVRLAVPSACRRVVLEEVPGLTPLA